MFVLVPGPAAVAVLGWVVGWRRSTSSRVGPSDGELCAIAADDAAKPPKRIVSLTLVLFECRKRGPLPDVAVSDSPV